MALNPSFKPDGRVTAGNASGIVDGAATVLLASERSVKRLGLKPRGRIVDQVIVGSEPVIMLTGPIPATKKVLQRTGLKIDDIDLIEINEAFAVGAPLRHARGRHRPREGQRQRRRDRPRPPARAPPGRC